MIDSGNLRQSLKWSRQNVIRSYGEFAPRPETDPRGCDTIQLKFPYHRKLDMGALFDRLIDLAEPSFAMLDLFPKRFQRGFDLLSMPEAYLAYEEPLAGEFWFTASQTTTGTWRSPDSFDLEARRRYRFLPELPWLGFLGNEFDGQFDKDNTNTFLFRAENRSAGTLMQLTASPHDTEAIQKARVAARSAFSDGFFRQ